MPRSAAPAGRRSSVERLVSPLPGRKGLSRGLMVSMMAAVEPGSGESRLDEKGIGSPVDDIAGKLLEAAYELWRLPPEIPQER